MNKELYKKEINKTVKDITVNDESIVITTEDSTIEISTYHSQDCCESVYGDFSIMKYYKEEIIGKEFNNLIIKSVEDMGFLIVFELNAYGDSRKAFIPCYNRQNGYYSSNLELSIKIGETETKIDISNLVEDQID